MRALVAAAGIVAGVALMFGHFGIHAVSAVDSCSPSRNAQLQPRWLHGAFESAGVEADARRRDAGHKSFLRWLTGLMPGHIPEPTFAFRLARWLLIGMTTAVVVAASWNGAHVLPWWAIALLERGMAYIATFGACTAALANDNDAPLASLFLTFFILVGVAIALCAISVVPIVVGVLHGLHAVLSGRVLAMLYVRTELSDQRGGAQASTQSKPADQSSTVPIGVPVIVGLQPSPAGGVVTGRRLVA